MNNPVIGTVDLSTLSHESAASIVSAALQVAESTYSGAVACAVTGAQGELIAYGAADGTGTLPRRLAIRKAYSAVLFKRDTTAVREAVSSGKIDMVRLADAELIAIPGGEPILVDGRIVGGVGVSGLTPDEDAEVARAALSKR
ncbi:MAG: heme-binding protein [Mycobacterium sp.]